MGGIGVGEVGTVTGRDWCRADPMNQEPRISNQERFNLMKSQVKTDNETKIESGYFWHHVWFILSPYGFVCICVGTWECVYLCEYVIGS